MLILADDLGYGDLGCYGCPDIRTPVLDGLAAEGVRFTNYYANAPECTPTRTALMTGRYQQRVGGLECAIGTGNVGRYDDAIRLAGNHDLGLPTGELTIIRLLKEAGYTAVGFGKWHLGYEAKFGPLEHGFDRFFGPLGGGVDYYFHTEWDGVPALYDGRRPVQRKGYLTDLISDAAVEFVRGQPKDRPFFLYLPYTAPHNPLQRPGEEPQTAKTQENWNEGTRQTYAAMVERLDEGIGKVLGAIDRRGFAANTLVVFASDNGGTKEARNAPFSGHKGGLLEGGIRVPCIVRWPGVLPPGRVTNQAAITLDLSRSLLRAAGAEVPADRKFDGIDILKQIESGPPIPRTLFWRQRRGERTWRAVRDGHWKYVSRQDGARVEEQLHDLRTDPAEAENLLADRPDEARQLKELLGGWEEEVRAVR
ncbi:MAG: sulfatase-like hydrolase/transferase [Rhodopirellula sp.]|nr:sulfatase-like hydrolase/transferase [Rhodopirellula sp.]